MITLQSNQLRYAIKKTYGKKGDAIVNMNISSIDKALARVFIKFHIHQHQPILLKNSKQFLIMHQNLSRDVTAKIIKGEGDQLACFKDS